MWHHRWRHRGPFWSSLFFVNSFRSNWWRESIKAPLCWHWALKSTDSRLWPSSSIHDLTLTRGQPCLDLNQTKNISFDGTWWGDVMVLEYWLCGYLCGIITYKPRTKLRPLGLWPELWSHQLTWGLKLGYKSLCLVTADMFAFPRSSSSISGETAMGSYPPPRSGRM